GTYTYRVAEGEPYEGAVILPSATVRPSPSRTAGTGPSPRPTGGSSPAPAPEAPAPAAPAPLPPADQGGTGAAPLPPLVGGAETAPLDGLLGLPPGVADPQVRAPDLPPVQALEGPLPGADTSRALGLPATLAALGAVGVASLLVRVLLAEPAAARRRPLTPVFAD
ncbi:MAG TPA: hypothetical protein VM433_09090, partial [Mycobacteriales bacterium]|nr:hypothetical protein [Mycobacteriales bacterium]